MSEGEAQQLKKKKKKNAINEGEATTHENRGKKYWISTEMCSQQSNTVRRWTDLGTANIYLGWVCRW